MIKIENPEIFAKCVADALTRIDANASLNTGEKVRAVNALAKAARRIETDGCFMDFDGDADRLVIWSQQSNQVYEMSPGRTCGCLAEQNGAICWHRAAKRLVELYNAAMLAALCSDYVAGKSLQNQEPKTETVAKLDFTDMPYLKSTDRRPAERVGGIRI